MTAVVIVGDLPSTGIIPNPVALRIADSGTPEASLAFLDLMAHALRERGAAVVLYPAWQAGTAIKLVRLARAILSTDRIAGIALDLPPLALSVVADQLTFMAPHVRPGMLAGLAHTLTRRLYSGTWVNSVAKLEHIKTGLGSHMMSYVPGGGFMVTGGEDPVVHRVTSASPLPEIGRRPLDPVLLLAAHRNGDVEWLKGKLQPELRAVQLTFVSAPPLSGRYWGAKKFAEFVAFSGHQYDLHHALQETLCVQCPWCDEPTALPVCAFCGWTKTAPQSGAAPAETVSAAPATAPVATGPAPTQAPSAPVPPAQAPPAQAPPAPVPPAQPVPMQPAAAPIPPPSAPLSAAPPQSGPANGQRPFTLPQPPAPRPVLQEGPSFATPDPAPAPPSGAPGPPPVPPQPKRFGEDRQAVSFQKGQDAPGSAEGGASHGTGSSSGPSEPADRNAADTGEEARPGTVEFRVIRNR
ncbi:hypothetical protein [Actinomadura macrotermitis]|uniref:Uncharacterized protein n=1 Tax=Actinomadura macrotermitis TaxID=2585200 RepID=A0A7K0BSK3_9ACTN|nr:hypothetical protein [Actinomadura macrotermitis]MQY03862.1 hypothetical protein [Actinomadura macrotermitis]